jgi:hypothetical protein
MLNQSQSLTYRAVYQRLARRLARDGEYLKTCRYTSRWIHDLGRHYVVDDGNIITDKDVGIVDYARELGLIKPDDVVTDEV